MSMVLNDDHDLIRHLTVLIPYPFRQSTDSAQSHSPGSLAAYFFLAP